MYDFSNKVLLLEGISRRALLSEWSKVLPSVCGFGISLEGVLNSARQIEKSILVLLVGGAGIWLAWDCWGGLWYDNAHGNELFRGVVGVAWIYTGGGIRSSRSHRKVVRLCRVCTDFDTVGIDSSPHQLPAEGSYIMLRRRM